MLQSGGDTGAAKALYYFRTGDILSAHLLHRLKQLTEEVAYGEPGMETRPCDRLVADMATKCAAGELEYMLVFSTANDASRKIGDVGPMYRVSTTHVTSGDAGMNSELHDDIAVGIMIQGCCVCYCIL